MPKTILWMTVVTLIISACSLPGQPSNKIPPEVDLYKTGTTEGRICFPSNYIPEMYLYLENVKTQEITIIPILENEGEFSAPVPPGTYVAYAWLKDFSTGGTYSQAVPCGLSVECNDHSLIEFQISSGEITRGVEICDWYGSPSDVPIPPNAP